MESDPKNNDLPDEWMDPNEVVEPDKDSSPDQPSMTGGSTQGGIMQPQSSPEPTNLSQDLSSTPNKDASPQAAVREQPRPSEKTDQHDIPTSPMGVSDTERAWFKTDEVEDLRSRWTSIQIQFVEEPCAAVEQGEALVAETIERVKQMIADRQNSIGQQWLNHDDISTEELRTTLLDYRALLNRILKL